MLPADGEIESVVSDGAAEPAAGADGPPAVHRESDRIGTRAGSVDERGSPDTPADVPRIGTKKAESDDAAAADTRTASPTSDGDRPVEEESGESVPISPTSSGTAIPDEFIDAATEIFGDRLATACHYASLLTDTGVTHGLIGPRESDRIWQRHLLNCAVLAELIEPNARVLDIGSGAGLPGIPLALARPDLEIVMLEPMARRVDWLHAAVEALNLSLVVERGRAEEPSVRRTWFGADVVTARAVAPLARLSGWALPLLRTGGRLLAMKGTSATKEVDRDRAAVRGFGGSAPLVVQCGGALVDPPTTVVVVERTAARVGSRSARTVRGRQR